MTEGEFRSKFDAEAEQYLAWGKYVHTQISKIISTHCGSQKVAPKDFTKISFDPRVKEINSLIAKAFYRQKPYKNPYVEITDKVGVRFVFLTESDVRSIGDLVKQSSDWIVRQDRDFEIERELQPERFEYQSNHFILFSKSNFEFEGVQINAETPCEVQLRTLLMHAYSELTHDTIYKPNLRATQKVKRLVARCSAMTEVAGEIFERVSDFFQEERLSKLQYLNFSRDYLKQKGFDPIEGNHFDYLLDSISDLIAGVKIDDISKFLEEKPFLIDRLQEKSQIDLLFSHPVAIIIYYLVQIKRTQIRRDWPFQNELLEKIFVDLGIAFEQ